MKINKLIIAIINKYNRLQEISTDIPGKMRSNVSRGTKHVISSYLEDILGVFISDLLPRRKYEILVDQFFLFGNSKSQFRPDICIIKKESGEKKIVAFIEVKDSPNPFRWNAKKFKNNGIKYINQRIKRLQEFRGKNLKYKDVKTKKKIQLLVDKKTKIDLVLISDQLFSKEKLKELSQACNKNKLIELHTLLHGVHPNLKGNSKGLEPQDLIKRIEKNKKKEYSEKSFRNRIKEIENI